MKLLKLEILNLASLDRPEGEVVNFEEGALRDASIFSIVGPTGSGKSTLLDAICLALYNRAPRYPKPGRGNGNTNKIKIYGTEEDGESNRLAPIDSRNILTRGKKRGYSKLSFLANDGKVYRAEWHVKFKSKNYDNARTELYEIRSMGDSYTEEVRDWDKLPQIIGLDYEQFLRTVLLAQGSFANFLNAKEEERYKLLEKLIGCEEMYATITERIKSKHDEVKAQYETIAAQVEAYKQYVLSDDDLAALEKEITELEESEKALEAQLKAIEKALEWYAAESKLAEDVQKQTLAETAAREALDAIKPAADRLALHDALAPAMDIQRDVQRHEEAIISAVKAITDLNAKIEQQNRSIAEGKTQKAALEAKAAEAQQAIAEANPHILEARRLRALIEPATAASAAKAKAQKEALKAAQQADKALQDNAKAIADVQQQHAAASQALTALKDEVEARQKQLADAEAEAAAKVTEAAKALEGLSADELQRAKDKAVEDLADLSAAIDVAGRIISHEDTLRANDARQTALLAENEACAAAQTALTIEDLLLDVETLKRAYTLMTSTDWAEHRADLADGDACPLCGSTHHPYAADSTKFDAAASDLGRRLKQKEEALAEQTKKQQELAAKVSKNEGEIKSLAAAADKTRRDLAAEEAKWAALLTRHALWQKDLPALEALMPDFKAAKESSQNALTAYNKAQQQLRVLQKAKEAASAARADYDKLAAARLREAEDKVSDARLALEGLTALTDNLRQQLADRQTALKAADAEATEAAEQLSKLQQQFNAELGGKNPDDVERQLAEAKAAADRAVSAQADALADLVAALGKLQGTLAAQTDQLTAAKQAAQARTAELDSWIADYNAVHADRPVSAAVVAVMLAAKADWSAIRQDKADREKALTSAATLRANAQQLLADHQLSHPEASADELRTQQDELAQSSRKTKLDAALLRRQQHADALLNMGDRAEALATAMRLRDDWHAIAESIGGQDGKLLRKIAQCYTLRFLIGHANAEIRKFNSRYELLQVKNSLGIRVIDHDRADDVRDTTSLSGGETFIVSLGLALGLSALSSRNISFDNLFIDEGFGTLDPDTLATVIDSLAQLQTAQGKKVGVISHTDTMSERITTQIRVVPNAATGSSRLRIYP